MCPPYIVYLTHYKGGGGCREAPVYFQMEMYYTKSEIHIMLAAYQMLIACGWEEGEAWAASYEVLSL